MSDQDATERFERGLRDLDERHYVLRLYVVGATAASQRACSMPTVALRRARDPGVAANWLADRPVHRGRAAPGAGRAI